MAMIGDSAIDMEPVETENLGSLAALILSELPACDDLLIRQKLGYALREFCRETDACIVEHKFKPEDIQEKWNGVAAVRMFGAPSGMVVGKVLEVCTFTGREIPFEVVEDMAGPMLVFKAYIGSLDTVFVKFSVYPKAGGEACPKRFKERYAEAITAGAMYHLLTMYGRGWSDAQRAAQYAATYQNAIAEAAYGRICGGAAGSGSPNVIPQGGLFM